MSRAPENILPTHLCRFTVRSPSTARDSFLGALRDAIGSTEVSPCRRPGLTLADLPTSQPHRLTDTSNRPRACAYSVIPITIVLGGTGIFNLFPITYAFLPRLRGRLTQGRRALPWKPWVFGEEDSHLLYRYLCHALSLVYAPVLLPVHLQRKYDALLPHIS